VHSRQSRPSEAVAAITGDLRISNRSRSATRVVRGYVSEARRRALLAADRHGLAVAIPGRVAVPPIPITVIGVYRARNRQLLERLVAPARASGATVALWALDDMVPPLAEVTVGTGPGPRFALLNEIVRRRPPPDDQYVVVVDDDIVLPTGVPRFVAIAARAGLDLAMPGHLPYSHYSHQITRRCRWAVARLTTYVEIGPALSISPRWRDRILPFPEDAGLGWGTEFAWTGLAADGCRLGIVDAAPLLHTVRPGRDYDHPAEMARLEQALRDHEVPDVGTTRQRVESVQRVVATWPAWKRTPPWDVTR